MKLKEFSQLLMISAREGAEKALAESNALQEQLSKAQAYRLYGRCHVDRWISEGLIIPIAAHGKASKKSLDRTNLDRVAASSNRITYQPVADRKK